DDDSQNEERGADGVRRGRQESQPICAARERVVSNRSIVPSVQEALDGCEMFPVREERTWRSQALPDTAMVSPESSDELKIADNEQHDHRKKRHTRDDQQSPEGHQRLGKDETEGQRTGLIVSIF